MTTPTPTPTPPPPTSSSSPLLRTAPLPGRGIGTLATGPIARGTRLLASPPILAATTREMLNADVLRASLVAAYTRSLDAAQRARVRDLAADPAAVARWREVFEEEAAVRRGWGGDAEGGDAGDGGAVGPGEKAHVMAAWGTNCFGIAGGESASGWVAVVAPEAARLNHGCVPNAVFCWNEAVGAITVQAIRGIEAGEEVVIAYVDVVGKGDERRSALRDGYGFECECGACTGGEEEVLDEVRERIGEMRAWLRENEGTREEEVKRSVRELVMEGVWLHETAGLVGVHLADFYEAVAAVTGEREYLEEELRVRTYCLGDDHPHIQRLQEKLANL